MLELGDQRGYGRYVAFNSSATNLVANFTDLNGSDSDVYLRSGRPAPLRSSASTARVAAVATRDSPTTIWR